MSLSGVIVNGRVEFAEAVDLPDGTPVSVEIRRPAETHAQVLQSLRDAHADVRAGNGIDAATAFARLNCLFTIECDAVEVVRIRHAARDQPTEDDL